MIRHSEQCRVYNDDLDDELPPTPNHNNTTQLQPLLNPAQTTTDNVDDDGSPRHPPHGPDAYLYSS